MNYNKKQRRNFYLKAARLIDKGSQERICLALLNLLDNSDDWEGYSYLTDYIDSLFPEFKILNESRRESVYCWWENDKEGKQCRIIALCLLANLCDSPL